MPVLVETAYLLRRDLEMDALLGASMEPAKSTSLLMKLTPVSLNKGELVCIA